MKNLIASIQLFFVAFHFVVGQTKTILPLGSPFITNYTDENYLDAGKNWGISQGADGKMYFANNYGLVQFDGYEWERIGQPNNQSELRAFILAENRIYIGGTAEIGFFEKDEVGILNYVELTPLLKDSTFTFNDVWDIAYFDEKVFFLTDNGILMYVDKSIQILGRGIPFRRAAYGINELVFGASGVGIFRFTNDNLEVLTESETFANIQVEFLIIIQPETYLIGTNTDGILKYGDGEISVWNPQNQTFFLENFLREGTILNKKHLIFGSLHEGIIITDYEGNIINIINEKNGLLDHDIRSIYKDKQGNIWTAVDGSVAYLELNSPFTILNKKNGLRGEVTCMLKYDGYLYVGTSRGLYIAEWRPEQYGNITFRLVPKTTGQCWQLFVHQDQLLLAHHNGIYTIDDYTANFIGGKGNWNFAPIPNHEKLLLSGNYAGITLLEKTTTGYQVKHQLTGFHETARELIFDDHQNIWISHGYAGIYKMNLSEDFTALENIMLYDEKKGLPSNLYNNLILIQDNILFGTRNGVYQYNPEQDRMELNPLFSPILKEETLVRKLFQMPNGNFLSIKDYDRTDQIELFEILEDGSFTVTETPFQKLRGQLIPAFESILFPNSHQILFGGKHGLIIYDTQFGEISDKTHESFIHEVSLPLQDSTIFSYQSIDVSQGKRSIQLNESTPLQFSFSTSFFEALPFTSYSTYLEGFDESWQDWTNDYERTFAHLPEGDYTFWVKSKNIYDEISQPTSFSFQIIRDKSLWSLSNWWSVILCIPIFGAFYFLYISSTKKGKDRIANLEQKLKEKEVKINQFKSKKGTWKKEKEQLNQKLSNALLKNEIHAGLVQNMEKLSKEDAASKDYKKAVLEFQSHLKEVQFQMKAHNSLAADDFLTKIKTTYPNLSPRELRLCSYLKLNVSSKEIAEYLCISVRGVESLRYRVRKKLGLSKGQDLTEFILTL